MPKYQCIKFGQCSLADAGKDIEIGEGDSFQCGCTPADPKCRENLELVTGGTVSPTLKLVLVAVPIAALLAFGAWRLIGGGGQPQPPASVEQLLTDVWPWLRAPQ